MADAVLGNMTKVGVGAGSGATTFEEICVFGGETAVDYGTYGTNKEYCLSQKNPFTSLTDLEFGTQTFQYLWSEGNGDGADVIIENAHTSTTLADKTITIQTEVNNSVGTGKKGTLYTADYMVTGYKHLFKKGEVNKTEFTVEQLTTPVETLAETV